MKTRVLFTLYTAVMLIMVAGCGDKSSAPKISTDTPTATFTSVSRAISNYQLQAVWHAMPKSYQADINKIITLSTEQMDAENYDKIMSLLKRIVAVMKSKKAIMLGAAKKMPVPSQNVEKGYDAITKIMDILVNSDIGKHSTMKNLNVEKFLAKSGSEIMKTLVEMNPEAKKTIGEINSVEVKELSRSGNNAEIEITDKVKNRKKKLKFVKVEGRWIPEDMAKGWKPGIEKSISQINAAKPQAAQMNAMLKQYLPEVEKIVVDLEKVNSEADLMALQTKIMSGDLMKMMMMMQQKK